VAKPARRALIMAVTKISVIIKPVLIRKIIMAAILIFMNRVSNK
jgi:hypothetical protein